MIHIRVIIEKLDEVRHRISVKLSRPLFMAETGAHGGYCYFAWVEGHGMYSTFAGILLAVILVSAAFGSE